MAALETYAPRYAHFAKLVRSAGVLTLRIHTDDGPFVLAAASRDLVPDLFIDLARDRENRVLIVTGTGDSFCGSLDPRDLAREMAAFSPALLDTYRYEGANAVRRFLEIEAPVILCLNGPALVHAEFWMAADIVLAAPEATVADFHIASGTAPGGDAQVVFETLLGHARAKYFLLTGQRLEAAALHDLGIVHELLPREELIPRAEALARTFTALDVHVLRYAKASVTERLRRQLALEQPYTQALTLLGINASFTAQRAAAHPDVKDTA